MCIHIFFFCTFPFIWTIVQTYLFLLDALYRLPGIINEIRGNANGTFTLNPILKEHEGEYVCKADNEVGEALEKKVSVLIHGNSDDCFAIYCYCEQITCYTDVCFFFCNYSICLLITLTFLSIL